MNNTNKIPPKIFYARELWDVGFEIDSDLWSVHRDGKASLLLTFDQINSLKVDYLWTKEVLLNHYFARKFDKKFYPAKIKKKVIKEFPVKIAMKIKWGKESCELLTFCLNAKSDSDILWLKDLRNLHINFNSSWLARLNSIYNNLVFPPTIIVSGVHSACGWDVPLQLDINFYYNSAEFIERLYESCDE